MLANSQQSPKASDLIDAITKSNIVTGESVGLPASESDRLRDTNIVPKSITTPLEVLPNLSGSEKTRTYNYGLELARAFFDFGLKNKKDAKEKTLIGSQAKAVDMASKETGPKLDKNKMSFWASVIAATIIIAELIWHYLGPIGVAISKFIIKLPMLFKALGGFKGLIKSLGEIKIFKVIAEFIKPIKGLIDSVKSFLGIGAKAATDVAKGAGALKGFGGLISKVTGTIGKFMMRWLKRLPLIGAIIGVVYAYERFKAGHWILGIVELLSAVLSLTPIGVPFALIIDGALMIHDLMVSKGYSEAAASSTAAKVGVGAARSLLPLLAKTGTKTGLKIAKVLKFIPFIGGLFNFASAYMRFKEGSWINGILEIIAGVASFTGVGTPLAWVIDGGLILYDLLEAKIGGEKAGGDAVKGVKLAVKLLPLLTKFGLKIGTTLLKVIKFIPFVGGLANLAMSYIRFKEGDWFGGILELVAGICAFIPVVQIVSYIIDGGLILYDLLKTKKTEESEVPAGKQQKGVLEKARDFIGAKMMKVLWYMPGISGLLYFGRGISKIVSGNIVEGLKDMARSVAGTVGGKGLVDLISYALGFLTTTETNTNDSAIQAKKVSLGDLISKLIDGLVLVIGNVIKSFCDWIETGLDSAIKGAKEKISEVNDNWNIFAINDKIDAEEARSLEIDKQEAAVKIRVAAKKAAKAAEAAEKQPNSPPTLATEAVKTVNPPVVEAVQPTSIATEAVKTVNPPVVEAVQPTSIATEAVKTVNPPVVEAVQPTSIATPLKNDLQEVQEPTIVNKTILTAEVVKQPAVNIVKPPESDFKSADLTEQNDIIMQQNGILLELLNTAKQQLLATRKSSGGSPVTVEGNSTTNATSFDTAFSTSKGDSRSMLFRSPYFLAANPA